jgi:hypothetical protein
MASGGENGRGPEQGIREILVELRDMRIEMRADRQRAEEDRRRALVERQRSDEGWRDALRRSNEAWKEERRAADERFERLIREFREDSARRDAATQTAFKDMRTVGLSIVKTLNLHTRILERIEAKLGARDDGRPGPNGGTASRR